jgi:hypothetical protein
MKRLVIGLGLALAPIIGWIAGGDEYIELRHDRSQIALMYYLIAFVFTALVAERLDERRASASVARSRTTRSSLKPRAYAVGDRVRSMPRFPGARDPAGVTAVNRSRSSWPGVAPLEVADHGRESSRNLMR